MSTAREKPRFWVLGGSDGEMGVIIELLGMAGEEWIQPQKEWGNLHFGFVQIGKGEAELRDITTIFVECGPRWNQENYPEIEVVFIDHHGELSGRPASVLQVLGILEKAGLKISDFTRRWVELVAANDCAAYAGMESLGATPEEIERVRAFTRKAQGITEEHKAVAREALGLSQQYGSVLVAKAPAGESIKNVCFLDLLYRSGRADQQYLLVGSGNFHFSGDGEICARLKKKFRGWAGGWGLGKKGDNRAFWGMNGSPKLLAQILAEIN